MYYQISDTLISTNLENCIKDKKPYVAVLTPEEWSKSSELFDMGIDMDMDSDNLHTTKAETNYDSLTGSFCIPDRKDISGHRYKFAFALDERGAVFIDHDGFAQMLIANIQNTKKWKMPSLERFLYDFLEKTISGDLALLEHYETTMNKIEADILAGNIAGVSGTINDIRGELLDLRTHYEQLIDLGQELEENENNFFHPSNLRYFRLFTERVARLQYIVASLREYTVQVRDLYQAQLDVKQNHIMTILTVVTTIFMPLTLIAGWYGMNFRYMPELNSRWGYPGVIILSVLIIIGSLIYFKKKKWL